MTPLDEIKPLVTSNQDLLHDIEPMVRKHEMVLFGDPHNRKDTGMVGAFNSMEELFNSLKSWGGRLTGSAIIALLLWAASSLFDMYVAFQQIKLVP